MKEEKQTKEKLLLAAKEEFMEKGYSLASLRSICKKANVTTGALYFFFENKKDLFASLVEEPLKNLFIIMNQHYEWEKNDLQKIAVKWEEMEDDSTAAIQIVEYLYEYHDAFVLLLTKAQGSDYETVVDQFVAITEKHYRNLADRMTEFFQTEPVDDYTIHWISHLQIFSFVQIITHGLTKEDALEHTKQMVKFFINGWYGIYR